MSFKAFIKNKKISYTFLSVCGCFIIWFLFFSLPKNLFEVSYSKVLYASDGNLLNAQVAKDHQWRFPVSDTLNPKFEKCIVAFEDKSFYHHIGISATGIGRALWQNIRNRKIVSGGSTITMQTIRLMRQNPGRTFSEKIYEMILALRLELRLSKKEILVQYAGHAPFGNNVVGLQAASWRYFNKSPQQLTWGQNALLAVLPNAPGLLYPGKNHGLLEAKRNRLLQKLFEQKIIDRETLELSIAEPIPDKPLPLPNIAWHYFVSMPNNNYQQNSTLDYRIQQQCLDITNNFAQRYQGNQVENIAIIVSDIHSGKILAYIGNTEKKWNKTAYYVDCAQAPRSTGSIIKPLLYYKALQVGLITPQAKLFDIPVSYNNFRPQNYARTYEGLIDAQKALSKSLNIPMVQLLDNYGLQKFHRDLGAFGFKHFNKAASYYGLSMILGSGEVSLKELNQVYTNWAAALYNPKPNPAISKACIYETLEAMSEVNRPDEDGNWKAFANTQKIAWKTGTSFGNRDAWSIGISSKYVVCVWVGNADGSGRTGLVGIQYAAPILFDIFNALPKSYQWFPKPVADYSPIVLCKASGYKAGEFCNEKDTVILPRSCNSIAVCPFHHQLNVNQEETLQVNASVYDWQKIKHKNYFILPPLVLQYYKSSNPAMEMPPVWDPKIKTAVQKIKIMYPDQKTILLFGNSNTIKIHFKAITEQHGSTLFWHIDQEYIGSTNSVHELEYDLPVGKHELMVLDEEGNQQQTFFEIAKAN